MRAAELQPMVDAADDAALLRGIDQLCDLGAWDELVELAHRCDEAAEFGRQLWGVRQHIEYRLALEAPPAWAAPVVRPGAARFALGPLTEVVAERFAWAEIGPHLDDAIAAAVVADERAQRGEDLRGEAVAATAELPLALAPFEPAGYARPVYRDREARFPAPSAPEAGDAEPVADPARPAPDATATGAATDEAITILDEVVAQWTAGAIGRDVGAPPAGPGEAGVRTVRVDEGHGHRAIAALAGGRPVRAAACSTPQAMAWLQWAGASGGAAGRRRGGAAGRFLAWSALAAVAGYRWPAVVDDDVVADLAEGADELTWWRWWRDDQPDAGWVLRLAVADPVDEVAYAIEAVDPPPDDLPDPLTG